MFGFLTNQSAHLESSIKAGSSAGIFYTYKYNENRAVETDIMFHYSASEIYSRDTGETADYSCLSIELPLYAMIQADIDNRSLYLGIGPFASLGLYSRYKSEICCINLYENKQNTGKPTIRRFDFGAGFILGYELKCSIQFNFNFKLGFRNLLDTNYENGEMISRMVSFGVGYRL
jgi:hypothetical protein